MSNVGNISNNSQPEVVNEKISTKIKVRAKHRKIGDQPSKSLIKKRLWSEQVL